MTNYQPKNLLVTGGAGFIGTNFVYYWLANYPNAKVIVLDALTYAGNKANLDPLNDNPNYIFVHGDILDQDLVEKLLREHEVNTVVHFAAESHVDRSIYGPDAFFRANIDGTHSMLKAAKKVWMDEGHLPTDHRFHHVSTDEVYGTLSDTDPAFTEQTAYAPTSPYAASKASSDHIVRAYQHTYGLKISISNCSNNYGPWQYPEKLIPLTISNLKAGKPIPIYGDGLQIRDWLYVDDHNRGIELILNKGAEGETYNLGGHNEQTNISLVRLLCTAMDKAFPNNAPHDQLITYVNDRPGHDRRYAVDTTKVVTELGYQPVETYETGIEKTLAWYLEMIGKWQVNAELFGAH